MSFNMKISPFFVEHELVLKKEELDFWASKYSNGWNRSTDQKKFIFDKELHLHVRYHMEIEKYDDAQLQLSLVYDCNEFVMGSNISFVVQSNKKTVTTSEPLFTERGKIISQIGKEKRSAILCSVAEALDPARHYFENGKLTVKMMALIHKKNYKPAASSTLGSLLWTRDDKDFVIVVKTGAGIEEKTEFLVHKLVLMAHSPVFDRMLQTNMKETKEGKVEIVDFGLEVVQLAIEFCYGREDLNNKALDLLLGLLKFADKYDIAALKEKIEYALKFQIYPKTVCELANASVIYNMQSLKESCVCALVQYIKTGTYYENSHLLDGDFATTVLRRAAFLA